MPDYEQLVQIFDYDKELPLDFVLESQLLRRKLPDKCLYDCELLPICMGGCRLQALVNQEDFDEIDCHYDSQRLFLEDYIREKASGMPLPIPISEGYEPSRYTLLFMKNFRIK